MIDPTALKEAVDAHDRRLDTVWATDRRDEELPVQQQVEAVEFVLPAVEEAPAGAGVEVIQFDLPADDAPVSLPTQLRDLDVVSRLDGIEQTLAALTEAVTMNQSPTAVPTWLQAAAGDPQSYDVPDPARMSVKVRVRPTIYARLEQARSRFGLQTMAGTWECLLRLGLAAAERMPARSS